MSHWKILEQMSERGQYEKDCCYAGPKKPVEASGGISNAIYREITINFTMFMKYRFHVFKSRKLKVKPQSFLLLSTQPMTSVVCPIHKQ